MKCAIVTPIGPGHEYLYDDALDSAKDAFAHDPGPFEALLTLAVDDTAGQKGRSAARNEGVASAAAQGIEWLFFLDADDVMVPQAFGAMAPFAGSLDAIWGQIACMGLHDETAELREGQLARIEGVADLLAHNPFLLVQMGHFVRTAVARATPFDTALDTGEDFDYYLRVWSRYRCAKIGVPLFINRRGAQSDGPRSASGRDWAEAVRRIAAAWRTR